MGLITECAERFPGGQMMFDLPPSWFAALGRGAVCGHRCATGCRRCRSACRRREAANLVNTVPGVRAVHDVPLPRGPRHA